MRRATIATMDNGLPVQCVSERDFLFPDADEKYVPDASAYIQSYDLPAFHALLRAGSPEDAVVAFPYLSDLEKSFVLPGAVRELDERTCGRVGRPAAAPHGMGGAEKTQRSRRGRHARRFRRIDGGG